MSDKVLVTYASRLGSTAGVAEAIGETLTQEGLEVDVLPMRDVHDIEDYRAVVAGSAIRDKLWLPEALYFMQTHRETLQQKPFAPFLVCMTLAMKNKKHASAVKAWLHPVSQQVQPISEGYFAGVLDISKIPSWLDRVKFRLSVLLGVWDEGDHRDWDAIRAWATELSAKLN